MLVEPNKPSDEQLSRAVLHLNGNITGLSLGIVAGLTIFIATVVLVVKGGSHVGQHLQLLNQFFIGYTVSWPGSFVGLLYGFVTGYGAGWLVAWIYNRIIAWKNR